METIAGSEFGTGVNVAGMVVAVGTIVLVGLRVAVGTAVVGMGVEVGSGVEVGAAVVGSGVALGAGVSEAVITVADEAIVGVIAVALGAAAICAEVSGGVVVAAGAVGRPARSAKPPMMMIPIITAAPIKMGDGAGRAAGMGVGDDGGWMVVGAFSISIDGGVAAALVTGCALGCVTGSFWLMACVKAFAIASQEG